METLPKMYKVPEPTLRRLPWYLSVCRLLKARGEMYVSSTRLSKEIQAIYKEKYYSFEELKEAIERYIKNYNEKRIKEKLDG